MNRKSLVARTVDLSLTQSSPPRPEYFHLALEPLEDRRMLAAYFNDNWVNNSDPSLPIVDGSFVNNKNDVVAPGSVIAQYGVTAFGKGAVGGSFDPAYDEIHEAIDSMGEGDVLQILGGTYAASDIILDKPITIKGDGSSGTGRTVIVPEVTSSGAQENFGVGTHSGFIIYSPTVTIQDIAVDGNGNGALGGSLQFHHGITTLYDTQNGGNYSSLHNGSLPLIVLGPTGIGEGGVPNESVPELLIDNVSVNNTFWHGITISPLANKTFDAGTNQDKDLQVRNSSVTNVGDVKDANRIGVLLQNINDTNDIHETVNGNVENVIITNVGVGAKTAPWGNNPIYGDRNTANNQARLLQVKVFEAAIRGFEILLANRGDYLGLEAHWASPSNATGVYTNFSVPTLAGLQISNAKIGVHVQNAPAPVQGGGDRRHPLLGWGATISGPGAAVPGSIGVLVDNDANSTTESNLVVYWDTEIKNFETGIRIEQKVAAPDPTKKNTILIADPRLNGNGTAIVVGNNSLLSGSMTSTQNIQVIGNGQVRPTMYNWDARNPFFYLNPGNSGEAAKFAPPKADTLSSGSISFSSGSTFTPLLTGESGSETLFDFNSAVSYQPSLPPSSPVNGIVPTVYGVLFGWDGNVIQDGSGQVSVGGTAKNGYGFDFMFGGRNRPTIPPGEPAGQFVLQPTDISDNTNIEIVMKLLPNNQSRSLWFGLFDFRGNAYVYTLDMSLLSSTEFRTLSVNMLTPVNNLTGPDDHVDLTTISGYVFGGDQGYANGVQNVPIGFSVDSISTSSTPNSVLKVNGTVNLGGANFAGSIAAGFAPSVGSTFKIIDNDGVDPVVGTFAGVPQGAPVNIDGQTFTVSYTGGDGNDVTLTASNAAVTEVVGRRLFYNQSKFDGNSVVAGVADDTAIATDKTAYQAGAGQAVPANVSSYDKGINGIMVDVLNPSGTLTVNDFSFKVGTSATPGSWVAAPAPNDFLVRPGAGTGGSTRVELLWAAGAIKNQWLQVTVEGNDAAGGNNTNTGLSSSDVFYFGNRIGDSFEGTTTSFVTNANDEIAARLNPGFSQPITRIYDFNRDGNVNATDQIVARGNGGFLARLNLAAPGPLAAPAAEEGDGLESAVASALAASTPASSVRVPGWISSRLANVNLNQGPIADLFTRLANADTPRSRAILTAANRVTDSLGLDDSLLESLIDDLGIA